MELRMAQEKDYKQLAEMKWLHCEEDDADYHTTRLDGVDKNKFLEELETIKITSDKIQSMLREIKEIIISKNIKINTFIKTKN